MSFAWLGAEARNVHSQFGEDGVVDAIFRRIGMANRWCFECGATDGLFFSNTRRLLREGWDAILVESDPEAFWRLEANCAPFGGRARCVNAVADALDPVLASAGAPLDIDLVVIDVDGQDCHLFNSMLRFRPRVVIIEFDPNAEPDFIPDLGGTGQAGLAATARLAAGRFYTPVFRSWCNLILVAQPLDQQLDTEIEPK